MENPYPQLAEVIPELEGFFIQELYWYFTTYQLNLNPNTCDEHNGYLIPSLDDIDNMKEGILDLAKRRSKIIDKIIIK
jgi:hypothetical protein